MLCKLYEVSRKDKGFTLFELMTVVVIIGILVAIAVPIYHNGIKDNTMDKADAANLRIIDGAVNQYLMKHSEVEAVDITINSGPGILAEYIQEWPTSPGTYTVVDGKAKSTYNP